MVNPFEVDLLAQVIDRLATQARNRSDPVYIAYVNMRRISEVERALTTPAGFSVLVRRRNHIIWVADRGAKDKAV